MQETSGDAFANGAGIQCYHQHHPGSHQQQGDGYCAPCAHAPPRKMRPCLEVASCRNDCRCAPPCQARMQNHVHDHLPLHPAEQHAQGVLLHAAVQHAAQPAMSALMLSEAQSAAELAQSAAELPALPLPCGLVLQ
eukprot:6183531-Pleurochrysis_carterae.AAC.2